MKKVYWTGVIVAGIAVISIPAYMAWNLSDPDKTCARCHEVTATCEAWKKSAHATVQCTDCHGSALNGGVKGLAEKAGMVYSHFTQRHTNEDLYLKEEQALAVAGRCAGCHQAEQANWQAGAHSVTYKDIFMNVEHNKEEKPYWDCLRCHGMHYDGNINDLMAMNGDVEDWHIKRKEQAERSAISCLACHRVHAEQDRKKAFAALNVDERDSLSYKQEHPATALYMRSEKRHIASDKLYPVTIYDKDSVVRVSDDPNTRLCMQCHAPNYRKEAGTSDDKTPTGQYEGMSCTDCHNPHSNLIKKNVSGVHANKSQPFHIQSESDKQSAP